MMSIGDTTRGHLKEAALGECKCTPTSHQRNTQAEVAVEHAGSQEEHGVCSAAQTAGCVDGPAAHGSRSALKRTCIAVSVEWRRWHLPEHTRQSSAAHDQGHVRLPQQQRAPNHQSGTKREISFASSSLARGMCGCEEDGRRFHGDPSFAS